MQWPTHPRELGLVTTAEAVMPVELGGLGMTARGVEWAVTSGKWQRLHRGVVLMHAGAVDWLTRAGAALVVCGPDAALRGPSAAVIHGLLPMPGASGRPGPSAAPIHVVVSSRRRPRPQRGVIVTHSDAARIIELWPWRTAYESTVVDLLAEGSPDAVTALLATALRERKTTVARLRAEAEGRQRLGNRRLVRDLLTEAADGVESPLERRFVHDVLRRHGLPLGIGQWLVAALGHVGDVGDHRRFDRGFPEYRVVVELDGALYHHGAALVADRHKSNVAARHGWLLLRFGWIDCTRDACASAAEVAVALESRGWVGGLRRCGPTCTVERRRSTAS